MNVGERIKQIREEKGISQEELANKLGLRDKSSVCKIEKAGDNISTKSIVKYANALGVTPAMLMGWENEEPPTDYLVHVLHSERDYEFMELYKQASPEVQQAVYLLLKSAKRDT